MSFERTNLHFTVRRKASGLAGNFSELLRQSAGGAGEPAIVYTLTTREAEEVAAALQVRPRAAGWVGAPLGAHNGSGTADQGSCTARCREAPSVCAAASQPPGQRTGSPTDGPSIRLPRRRPSPGWAAA
jgi:hypothetical protein